MTQDAQLWAQICTRCHYCVTLTPRVIKCDKLEGVMKKKMGFRCDNYYICLLVPPPPHPTLPSSSSSDVLLVCHIAHIFICWLAVMRDRRTGAELHAARCNVWIWYRHICHLPYRTGGGVSLPVVYLFVLAVSFKGYSIKVLISSRSCWNDAIGYALGCPQMLSHRDTLFFLMINVCSGILYLLALNRPVCSCGSVVRRLVVA